MPTRKHGILWTRRKRDGWPVPGLDSIAITGSILSLPQSVIQDKFEVLHKISEGGMGAVYKVRHILLEQPFVIKVIRPQHRSDQDLQERFRLEAQATIRLRHTNIAEIHDFSIGDDGTAYIVMEYIEGATLKQILNEQGPPDLGLTMEIAAQSLKALSVLHKQKYIHRDISPDNLMLTRSLDDEPLIKLIDLGLAKRLGGNGDLTTTGMFLGKIRYSAPEQFKGKELDARSDLYSFGVMLYQLLTGQCPIQGEEFSELVTGHLLDPPLDFAVSDPEGRIPQGLRKIVLRTLAKEPDHRVDSAESLAKLLEPFRKPGGINSEELSKTIELARDDRTPMIRRPVISVSELTREESVALVEQCLKDRELDEAKAILEETEHEYGIDENTQQLRTQLATLRRREREERMNALLERARRHIATNKMEEALETLQEATEVDSENISAQTLLLQVQTTVDRQHAARPKQQVLIWGLAAAGALLLLALGWQALRPKPQEVTTSPQITIAPQIAAAQMNHDLGVEAYEKKDWQTARRRLQAAIELNPMENAEGPYLPHYYLGMVSAKRFNCQKAFAPWQESEKQGVIHQTEEYKELVKARADCEAEFTKDTKALRTKLENSARLAHPLIDALDNPQFSQQWREAPQVSMDLNRALQDLDDLRLKFDRADAQKDYNAIFDLEEPVIEIERRLEQLTDQVLALGQK